MNQLNFNNRFVAELPGDETGMQQSRQTQGVCWSAVSPTPVQRPTLLAYSSEVLRILNLSEEDVHSEDFLAAFCGNRLLPGMTAYASCYGGHQFGNWAGQLGDGRAIALGEVLNRDGERWELQLKGAGMTPYSRRADGRAVLRSSLREFLCSEAMHHLGIPSTRALSLIATGENVMRDMLYDGNPAFEPGAVVCRVAPSFIRFGNFEILAARGEHALLQRLVDFTIARDFPQIDRQSPDYFAIWFKLVCERTAQLVVEWLRVGFVHGVMNTDNMSIIGLTLDYGPYGWVDNFDPDWTPNTTDAEWRRYSLAQQPPVARWNLERLADALAAVAPSRALLDEGLVHFDATLQTSLSVMLAGKFGLLEWKKEDAALTESIFELMQRAEVDMTEFFRALANVSRQAPDREILRSAFYREPLYQSHSASFNAWLERYVARLTLQQDTDEARRIRMNRVNPRFVLRNYLAQQAIDAATNGNMSLINRLMEAARHPYDDDIPAELTAKRPDWAINKPGCSMLSCSS
ncbi:MAG: YdiU family protein [Gallionella sp.]|nr:YdiU family protein [Gallionella sp.]